MEGLCHLEPCTAFLDGRAGDTDTSHVVAGDAVLDTGRGRSIWQIGQVGADWTRGANMNCDLQVVGPIVHQPKIRSNMDEQAHQLLQEQPLSDDPFS
jgi:hypothetical protein